MTDTFISALQVNILEIYFCVLMSRIKASMLSREEPLRQEYTLVKSFCNKIVKDKKSCEPHSPETDCYTVSISKDTATSKVFKKSSWFFSIKYGLFLPFAENVCMSLE